MDKTPASSGRPRGSLLRAGVRRFCTKVKLKLRTLKDNGAQDSSLSPSCISGQTLASSRILFGFHNKIDQYELW